MMAMMIPFSYSSIYGLFLQIRRQSCIAFVTCVYVCVPVCECVCVLSVFVCVTVCMYVCCVVYSVVLHTVCCTVAHHPRVSKEYYPQNNLKKETLLSLLQQAKYPLELLYYFTTFVTTFHFIIIQCDTTSLFL